MGGAMGSAALICAALLSMTAGALADTSPAFIWTSSDSFIPEDLTNLSTRTMVSKEVLSSAIRGTVASGRAGDVLLVFLGRGTSMRELNGTYVEEAVRSSPTHVAFAGVESAQDAVADAVEGWEVLFDASCLAHGGVGDLFSALREAPRPTAAVVCSSADGSAEAAALKHALGVVGEATGGRWAAVYVGGEGMSPKAPTRGGRSLRNVPATEQCDRKCRTQVAAIEAVIVALVLISFIVPSYFLMRKLESPSKFEKSGEHRD